MDTNTAVAVTENFVNAVEVLNQLPNLRIELFSSVPREIRTCPNLTSICTRASRGGASLQPITSPTPFDEEGSVEPMHFCLRLVAGSHTGVRYTPMRLTVTFGPTTSSDNTTLRLESEPLNHGDGALVGAHDSRGSNDGAEAIGDDERARSGQRESGSMAPWRDASDPTYFWKLITTLVIVAAVSIVFALAMRSDRRGLPHWDVHGRAFEPRARSTIVLPPMHAESHACHLPHVSHVPHVAPYAPHMYTLPSALYGPQPPARQIDGAPLPPVGLGVEESRLPHPNWGYYP